MADAPEKIYTASMGSYNGVNIGAYWSEPSPLTTTEFIRADLVDELVKALDVARERVEHWADVASRADRTRYDTSDDLAKIDAALTRIKGDGK